MNVDESKGLSYFFLGLGIGVAVGMIFAPQAGAETRGQIRSKAQEGGDYLRRRTADLKEGAASLVDKGKEAIGRQRDQIASAVDAGRQAYRDTLGEVRDPGSQSRVELDEAAQGL